MHLFPELVPCLTAVWFWAWNSSELIVRSGRRCALLMALCTDVRADADRNIAPYAAWESLAGDNSKILNRSSQSTDDNTRCTRHTTKKNTTSLGGKPHPWQACSLGWSFEDIRATQSSRRGNLPECVLRSSHYSLIFVVYGDPIANAMCKFSWSDLLIFIGSSACSLVHVLFL